MRPRVQNEAGREHVGLRVRGHVLHPPPKDRHLRRRVRFGGRTPVSRVHRRLGHHERPLRHARVSVVVNPEHGSRQGLLQQLRAGDDGPNRPEAALARLSRPRRRTRR